MVGCGSIAEYVQDISERITQSNNEDEDEEFSHIPEEDRKSYKKSDIKLLIASSIVSEIRAAVKEQTGYECSAGIAHNKILAKLVCGMNKPNKQTILPLKQIPQLFKYEKLFDLFGKQNMIAWMFFNFQNASSAKSARIRWKIW